MNTLVVLFSVIAAAAAAPQWLVQPANTPAVVLDPYGRPLDTAEVASARALHYQAKALEGHILKKRSIGHALAYTAPSAVSHQSRVDVHSSPALVATAPVVSAPVYADYAEPIIEARALYAPSAVSHQSRVDVRSSPAIVAPVVASSYVEPIVARAVYAAPHTAYVGGSAVSHQSRVDVQTSPAVVTEQLLAPAVVEARSVWSPSAYATAW